VRTGSTTGGVELSCPTEHADMRELADPHSRPDECGLSGRKEVSGNTLRRRAKQWITRAHESKRTKKEKKAMATQTQTATAPDQEKAVEQKIKQLRELYADAPEVGKTAMENAIQEQTSGASSSWLTPPRSRMESAGRAGNRQGKVSELTMIAPFAEGGAKRLRAFLQLREGNYDDTDKVGTVHDMRFAFLDNDTKLLFATAYDGDWDPYIDDFVTKIPNELDLFFCNVEGWPGIHSPAVKDWIVQHQIPTEGWYVANPNLTVVDTRRLERVGQAVDEFLDKIGD
jgi:hypothetical protein